MGVVYVPTVPAGLIFLPVTFHRHKNLFFFSEKKMRNTTQAFLKKKESPSEKCFSSHIIRVKDVTRHKMSLVHYILSLSLSATELENNTHFLY